MRIYLIDETYDRYDDEAEASRRYKSRLEAELSMELEERNIGAGADLPSFLAQIDVGPLLAVVTLFFLGTPINENLDAWPKIFSKFKSFLKYPIRTDGTAAAIIAIQRVFEELGGLPRSVVLKKYWATSPRSETSFPIDVSEFGIGDEPNEEELGDVVHNFVIVAENLTFQVSVIGNRVDLIKCE